MSIRMRLALWYSALLALMFLVFAPIVYFTLERELLLEADRWLAPLSDRVQRSIAENPQLLNVQASPGPGSGPVAASWLEDFSTSQVFVQLLDPNGRAIAASPNAADRRIAVPDSAFAEAWWGKPSSFTGQDGNQRYRGILTPIPGDQEPRGFVLVGSSLQPVDDALGRIRILLLAGNVFGLLLAVVVGWLIARNGLRPIEEITQTARAIALSQGFGRRLKVQKARDEVGQLAVTFNEMLASLDSAYAAQRRFVADASHELRSPLTSIKSNVEILRRALDAPREDREDALADVASEVDRLSRLTSDLLLLARADTGHRIEMTAIPLDRLITDVCRQIKPRADGLQLAIETLEPVVVRGNDTWLKQLLWILVDNALKYTPKGGSVTLSLGREEGSALVQVRDTGIGISAKDLPHIFERFYRADKARARDEGGTGLGLAVARWIAEEHNGDLSVQSEPGKGTTFTLRLPTASPPHNRASDISAAIL